MDWVIFSREDYIEFHTQKISPASKEYADLIYSEEFDRMQGFVYDRCAALPLYKRIGLAAAFALMLVGLISTFWLALKCLFM